MEFTQTMDIMWLVYNDCKRLYIIGGNMWKNQYFIKWYWCNKNREKQQRNYFKKAIWIGEKVYVTIRWIKKD